MCGRDTPNPNRATRRAIRGSKNARGARESYSGDGSEGRAASAWTNTLSLGLNVYTWAMRRFRFKDSRDVASYSANTFDSPCSSAGRLLDRSARLARLRHPTVFPSDRPRPPTARACREGPNTIPDGLDEAALARSIRPTECVHAAPRFFSKSAASPFVLSHRVGLGSLTVADPALT